MSSFTMQKLEAKAFHEGEGEVVAGGNDKNLDDKNDEENDDNNNDGKFSNIAAFARTIIENKVRTLFENISDKSIAFKYLQQLQDDFVPLPRHGVGGVLPICVDPETSKAYFLMGREKLRKRESVNDDEFFYTDESGRLQIRNSLCHFHGFLDQYETFEQGVAREGYEESRGTFGSLFDIWRAVSDSSYSFSPSSRIPCVVIYLGLLTESDRYNMERQFQTMPVYIPCMAETYSIHFVPINELYAALRHVHLSESDPEKPIRLNITDIVPSVPNNSMWLRPFLQNWLLSKKYYDTRIPNLTNYTKETSSFHDLNRSMICCPNNHLMMCFPAGELPTRIPSPKVVCCGKCTGRNLPENIHLQPYFHCTDCHYNLCTSCTSSESATIVEYLDTSVIPLSLAYPYITSGPLQLRDVSLPKSLSQRNLDKFLCVCSLCDNVLIDTCWPVYVGNVGSEERAEQYFHAQCLLRRDHSSSGVSKWIIKPQQDLARYLQLRFFCHPILKRALRGEGVSILSMSELPLIDDPATILAGHEMLTYSEEIATSLSGKRRAERMQKECAKCQHPIFVEKEYQTLCYSCLAISNHLKDLREVAGERGRGERGRRGRSRDGGRGRGSNIGGR